MGGTDPSAQTSLNRGGPYLDPLGGSTSESSDLNRGSRPRRTDISTFYGSLK